MGNYVSVRTLAQSRAVTAPRGPRILRWMCSRERRSIIATPFTHRSLMRRPSRVSHKQVTALFAARSATATNSPRRCDGAKLKTDSSKKERIFIKKRKIFIKTSIVKNPDKNPKTEYLIKTNYVFITLAVFLAGVVYSNETPVDPPPPSPEHVNAAKRPAAAIRSDAPIARAAMKPARCMTDDLARQTKDTGK